MAASTRQAPTLPRAVASRIERDDWTRRNLALLMAAPRHSDGGALLWAGVDRAEHGIVPHGHALRDPGSGSRSGPVWLHGPDNEGAGFMLMVNPRRRPRYTGGRKRRTTARQRRVVLPGDVREDARARERATAGTIRMGDID